MPYMNVVDLTLPQAQAANPAKLHTISLSINLIVSDTPHTQNADEN